MSWVECQSLFEAGRCLADRPALGVEHAQSVPVIRAARLNNDRAVQGGATCPPFHLFDGGAPLAAVADPGE